MLSRIRIESMPRRMTTMLTAQNARKQTNWAELISRPAISGSLSQAGT